MLNRGTNLWGDQETRLVIGTTLAHYRITAANAFARRAIDDEDPILVMLARSWPIYDQLRADLRFHEIVGLLNLPGWARTP